MRWWLPSDVAPTGQEAREPLPGDEQPARRSITLAANLPAPPPSVWPWLAQMGTGRAGWYAWDALDNGGIPSAMTLLPELAELTVGDRLLARPGGGLLEVAAVDPGRLLLLRSEASLGPLRYWISWAFVLRHRDGGTRIITRHRATWTGGTPLSLADRLLFAPTHAAMQTRQLRGLARRLG